MQILRCAGNHHGRLEPLRLLAPTSMQRQVRPCVVLAMLSACTFATSVALADAGTNVSAARLLHTPSLPMPGYLEPSIDPAFGTSFMRITDPGREFLPGVRCAKEYCRHRYSSTQAWNADQSLLVISKGCADLCFLDGHTYKPLFARRVSQYHDCKWHPHNPDKMICAHRAGIDLWAPRTDTWTAVYRPVEYGQLEFGPYKGNPSRDGNIVVLRARDGQQQLVAFAYDIGNKHKFPDIQLSNLVGANLYVTVSASGRYVYVSQLTADGKEPAYVFTVEGEFVQHWPDHHRPGHGDMAIDADGTDVYVGISKSPPDEFHVIKRRLKDGKVTSLVPYGDASHVSARNIRWPGWVFVSYQGSFEHTSTMRYPAPFYGEVIALRIDGSGEIRRIAQTRSVMREYLSEMHASPSPDGSRVVWASNWGVAGGPISDYVTHVTDRQPLPKN